MDFLLILILAVILVIIVGIYEIALRSANKDIELERDENKRLRTQLNRYGWD
jgi:Tfp pilus assembly protein PilO